MFRRVCDEIASLGLNATIFTLTPDGRRLRAEYLTFESKVLRAAERLANASARDYSFELTRGSFYERILEAGDPVFSDSGAAPIADALPRRVRPFAAELARILGVERAIYVPLTVEGRRYGLMTVLGSDLSEKDVAGFEAFGGQIAIAVENAHAYQDLQVERDRAQRYLDVAAVILIAVDRDGRIALINRRGCEVLGRSEEELVGQDWFETCLPPRIRDDVRAGFDDLVDGVGELYETSEGVVLRADGEERTVSWHNTVLRDAQGRISGMLSSGEDISERQRAEEETRRREARFRAIFESSYDAIFLMEGLRFVECNEKTLEIYGCDSPDQILGYSPIDFSPEIQPDGMTSADKAEERMGGALEGDVQRFEWRHVRLDGTEFDAEVSLSPLDLGGRRYVVAIARDISERKQAEAAVQQYQFIVNTSHDLMTLIDAECQYVAVSDSFCACQGRKREEIIGRTVAEIWGETPFEDGIRPHLDVCLGGEQSAFNGWIDVPSNGRRFYDVRYTPFRPNRDAPPYAVVVSRDITEQIRALEALQEAHDQLEERIKQRTAELRAAIDAANAASFRHDLATGRLTLDDRWYQMAGVSREEFPDTQAAWEQCLHPDDRGRITREIDRKLSSDATEMQIEYRLLRPDGGVRHIESRSIILRDGSGRATGTVGLNIDVTSRREVEKALNEGEAFLRTTLDNLPAHFWATDRELRFTVQNELSRQAMGDVHGKRLEEIDIPNDLAEPWIRDNERVLAGETVEQEFTFPIDGEERAFMARISPILLDGEVVGTIGTSIDITDRVSAEGALRENEAYLRSLMENMPIDFFAVDADMRYRMQSGLSRSVVGDLIGRRVDEADAPEALVRQWIEEHAQVLGGETIQREYHIPMGGEERTFMTTVAPVRVGEEVIGTVGTSMDITARERMEEALRRARDELEQRVEERTRELRESEERFRTLFVQAPDAFFITDLNGVFVDGNRAAAELVGLPKADLVGRNFIDSDLLSPEDLLRAKALLSENLQGRPTGPDELLLRRPGGGEIPIEIRSYPFPLAGRAVVLSIARDVTERRRMIESLREAKELAEGMIDTANAIVVELDPNAKIERFNRFAERVTGYSRGEVIGRNWFETFLVDEDRDTVPEVLREVMADRPGASSYVNPIVCKDGTRRIIEWRNTTITGPDGTARGVLAIGIDITERERALEDLRTSERKVLEAFEGTVTAFAQTVEARDPYTAGHQEHVARLAASIADKIGMPKDGVEAVRVAGLLHDIGKMGVPAEILAKPTELTAVEASLIQQHPVHGNRILQGVPFPWPIAEIVRQHHERMDGTGYPDGLQGDEILLPARILAVADTVEAMASHRPYRPARGLDAALEVIRDGRGRVFDARVVDACVELFEVDGFAFEPSETIPPSDQAS